MAAAVLVKPHGFTINFSLGVVTYTPTPCLDSVLVILEVHQPNASTMQTMSTIQIVEDVIYKSDPLCTIV